MNFIQHTTDITGNALKTPIKLKGADAQNVNKVTQYMVDLIRHNKTIWRKEISDWQRARQVRRSLENPQNYLLQEVYEDTMMDGQLTGITENRTFRTTNKDFIFVDKEGKKDDTCTEFIKEKTWFEDFIKYAHESVYYGTGVVWLKEVEKGEIKAVELIEKGNVISERNLILLDVHSSKGINYTDYPELLIEVQMYGRYGILEKATPYTILKRHSWGSWDEFEELFGVPIRIAKIASQSEQVKTEVAGWLEDMGSAPYAVVPLGTEIDIKENSKGDAFNVFFQKIKACREELSMLILHQTMTTENGGSKAQGTVHENTLNELIYADEKKILSILNDKLVPAMKAHGYAIPEGYKIAVAQTKDPTAQIAIDSVFLNSGYILPASYISEVYGTEIEQMPVAREASSSKDAQNLPTANSEKPKKN